MTQFQHIVKMIIGASSVALSLFLGDSDALLITLLVFVCLDYITGVIVAIIKKRLSSDIGYKGILKKILILLIVGAANFLDRATLTNGSIRAAVIIFYIANEGISILENASNMGLPIPAKIKNVLEQLRTEDDQ